MRLRQIDNTHHAKRAFDFLLRAAPALTMRGVRHICVTVLLGGFITLSVAWADGEADGEAAAFLSALEDVPLMAGLTEDETAALEFDKPDGRLAEAYAYGEISREDAAAFYTAIMPEFGWRKIDGLVFSREGEMLRIFLIAEDRSLLVRFVLSPQPSQ
jgi:hypothetical protein